MARDKKQLNGKEGTATMKGALTPPTTMNGCKQPPEGGSGGIKTTSQTPFLNPYPFQQWYRIDNVAKVKINGGKLHGLFGEWCPGKYHHAKVCK